jgi:hypothetical protein
LAEECINVCENRFEPDNNIEIFLNDGRSLDMIASKSVDLVFSFDSLVNANPSAIEGYLCQLDRVLTDNGVAFIHRSNLRAILKEIGNESRHVRNPEVDAGIVESLCIKLVVFDSFY